METVIASLQEYGVLLVFANVLLQQLGAPVPTMPTLIVAGALSVTGVISPIGRPCFASSTAWLSSLM